MAKSKKHIIRLTFVTNTYVDYILETQADVTFLLRKITQAIDTGRSVQMCDNVYVNTKNIILVEVF